MQQAVVIQSPVQVYQRYGQNYRQVEANSVVKIQAIGNCSFAFEVDDVGPNPEVLMKSDISSCLNTFFSMIDSTFNFDISYNNILHSFSLGFQNPTELERFANAFVNCLFEFTYKKRPTAQDLPEIERIISYMRVSEPPVENEDDEFFEDDSQGNYNGAPDNGKNSLLRNAPHTNSILVTRNYNDHSGLGIFSQDCAFQMSIPSISDATGQKLIADDALTHSGDHGLFVLDQKRPYEVFNLNLDRGMVTNHVNSIDASGKQIPVVKLLHTENGNSTSPTFVGFNERDTLMFDPRVQCSVVNHSEYKTNNKFTCGITTSNGKIAMGSNNGIVRLYKEPCKTRATINFQINVGNDPIIGIDVSPDERWVVATCPYYLSVFDVLAKSTGKLGFDSPMGKDKPPLIRLYLSSADIQTIASNNGGILLPFTPAKFEISHGKVVAVVASMGNSLISWNFSTIERGKSPKYSIKFVQCDQIVDDMPIDSSSKVIYISPNLVSAAKSYKRGRC